jgi:hypothetical protein
MKYSCCFINAVTGDQRTVIVELDDEELLTRGATTESMARWLGPT